MKRKNPDSGVEAEDDVLQGELIFFLDICCVENPYTFFDLIQDSEEREKVLNMAMELREALREKEERARKITGNDVELRDKIDLVIRGCNDLNTNEAT